MQAGASIAHKHFRRLLTSSKVNRLTHVLLGHRLRNFMEARDWGWTLMLKAKKKGVELLSTFWYMAEEGIWFLV